MQRLSLKMLRRLLFLLLLIAGNASAQTQYNSDSLWHIYNDHSQADTTRMRALHRIAWLLQSRPDSMITNANNLLAFAKEEKQEKFMGYAENDLMVAYEGKSLYALAMEHAHRALDHWTACNFEGGEVAVLMKMGVIMHSLDQYDEALDYWSKSLEKAEKIQYTEMINVLYLSMGEVYLDERRDTLALHYFLLANKMHKKLHEEKGLVMDGINLGETYRNLGKTDSSMTYLSYALINGKRMNMIQDMPAIYGSMAYTFLRRGENERALDSARQGLKFAHLIHSINDELLMSECLRSVFDSMHNSDSAYSYFRQAVFDRDSLNHEREIGMIHQNETQTSFQKKVTADSMKALSDQLLDQEKLNNAKTRSYYLYAGIFLVVIFSLFIFNRLRVTQKQKQLIEQQRKEALEAKEIIQEKNREITDSIRYAKRIQQSHLPPVKVIERNLERLKKKD